MREDNKGSLKGMVWPKKYQNWDILV